MADYTSNPILLEDPCPGEGSGSIVTAPDTPAAPVLTKNCGALSVVVNPAAWADNVTSLKIRRRLVVEGQGADVGWTTIATIETDADYTDNTGLTRGLSYEYSVAACNSADCSLWSASATVSFVSSVLEVAISSPTADADLSGNVTVAFTLADSGETLGDCSNPILSGSCIDDEPAIEMTINGNALAAPTLFSGTPRNGLYKLTFSSKDYSNGVKTIKVESQGTDCCWASAEVAITFTNTSLNGIRYIHTKHQYHPPTGKKWVAAEISFQNEAISTNPARQWLARNAVLSTPPAVVFGSDAVTPADKEAEFAKMSPVPMSPGQEDQVGATWDGQLYAVPALTPTGNEVHWVQQWNPYLVWSAEVTGYETISRIIPSGDETRLILARNPSSTGVGIFEYTYGSLASLFNLADYGLTDATEIAQNDEKVFVVANGKLIAFDRDSGQKPLLLMPFGETRSAKFVAGDDDKMFAVFVDAALETLNTSCWDMTYDSPNDLWTLDGIAGAMLYSENTIWLGVGDILYKSDGSETAPSVEHTFDNTITAIYQDEDRLFVGLSNGDLWAKTGSTWAGIATLSASVTSITSWKDKDDNLRGVSGDGTESHLYEESSIGWFNARNAEPLDAMTETITGITSLSSIEVVIQEGVGSIGDSNYIEEIKQKVLLIGTSPSGVVMVLEPSPYAGKDGFNIVSKTSHYSITPEEG